MDLESMYNRLSVGLSITVEEQRFLFNSLVRARGWDSVFYLDPIYYRCEVCGGNGCPTCNNTGRCGKVAMR